MASESDARILALADAYRKKVVELEDQEYRQESLRRRLRVLEDMGICHCGTGTATATLPANLPAQCKSLQDPFI